MELEHEILSASQHIEDKNFNSIVSVGQEVIEINQTDFLNTWE